MAVGYVIVILHAVTTDIMTHTYKISGMTCSGCEAKVKWLLGQTDQVEQVDIDLTR